jgi:HD superfamily phosphodiesterase
MNSLSIAEIEKLTLEYGDDWAVAHVQRLLKLIDQIGAGMEYDRQALTWAVYLHDWGAFAKFAQPNCEHALRSKQIAETEFLPQVELPADIKAKIIEAIELHDYRDKRPVQSAEALLLREADFLDFLGVIGIAREFAKGPKNIQKSYQQLLKRKEEIKDRFTIPLAKKIAEVRLERMDEFFEALLDESFGYI